VALTSSTATSSSSSTEVSNPLTDEGKLAAYLDKNGMIETEEVWNESSPTPAASLGHDGHTFELQGYLAGTTASDGYHIEFEGIAKFSYGAYLQSEVSGYFKVADPSVSGSYWRSDFTTFSLVFKGNQLDSYQWSTHNAYQSWSTLTDTQIGQNIANCVYALNHALTIMNAKLSTLGFVTLA
jgi:hypothetical protein